MKFGSEVPFKVSNFGFFFNVNDNNIPIQKLFLSPTGDNVLKILWKLGSAIQISYVITIKTGNSCSYMAITRNNKGLQ